MDIGFFLNKRIAFIRQFYDNAAVSFLEHQRKIEAEEEPFIPPYSESGEPPFLDEWLEASESLQVLGYSCVSMLSATLYLYLKTWESELNIPVDVSLISEFKKKGWFNGYKLYFASNFRIHFEKSPADLLVIEEVVLARNRVQHPDSITTIKTNYSSCDIEKIPNIYFSDNQEKIFRSDTEGKSWIFPPTLHIPKEKLFSALEEVEKFGYWLEEEISEHIYRSTID